MKYGVDHWPHVSVPPCGLVLWVARRNGSHKWFYPIAPSWFDARRQALLHFGCESDEIEVAMVPADDTPHLLDKYETASGKLMAKSAGEMAGKMNGYRKVKR